MKHPDSNAIIEEVIKTKNNALATHFSGADIITIKAPLVRPLDSVIKKEIEGLRQGKPAKGKLVVVLETTGGYIEVVERIYTVFRHHYDDVKFIVPNYAYSAGTVLALSGDDIYMDYYSVLGPIDPQYENDDGKLVPGLGYLQKYNDLIKQINANPDDSTAEVSYLIKKFDPGTLFLVEEAKKQSEALLIEWLPKHKFKDWIETETRKLPVNDAMRADRAKQVAEELAKTDNWHSHGRGIGITRLMDDKIKLKIKNYGDIPQLDTAIRELYNLLMDFTQKTKVGYYVYTINGLKGLT